MVMFSGKYSMEGRGKIGQDIWTELGDKDLVFTDPEVNVHTLQYKWEFEQFLEVLDQRHFSTVLEIGSWHGGSLYQMMKRADSEAQIMSISEDISEGTTDLICSWAKDFGHTALVIKGDSHDSIVLEKARSFFSVGLDLLFIDGDHSYEGCKQDFMDYGPLILPGGLIVLQDIIWTERCPQVMVSKLWQEVREAGYIIQELYTHSSQGGLGIGIIYI
jgi:cephalosporin hydroxylase